MSLKLNVVPKRYFITIKTSSQKNPTTFNLEAESAEKAKLEALEACEQEGLENCEVLSCVRIKG